MPARMKKRSDGRFQASVMLGRNAEGKVMRKYFYGMTQKEANAKKQAYLDEEALASDATRMTLEKWASIWLKTYAKGGARNMANNLSILKRFQEYIGPNTKLQDIKPAHVQAYAKEQAAYTKSHVDKVRRTLTNMFRAAQENDYIAKSPCVGIVWDSVKTGTHEALEPYLKKLLTDYWRIHPAGVWAMFMLYAGLRPSEAFALQRENVTEDGIVVTDGSHFEHGQLVVVKGQVKTEAGQRVIPILPPLKPVLSVLPESGHVCLSASGRPVSEAAARSNWAALWNMLEELYNGRVPRKAGRRTDRLPEDYKRLPKVNMYDLRHTFCTMLYDADTDVKTAQYLMGHASLDMTLKIYTHLSEEKKLRSYDKLYSYFTEKSGEN